MNKSVISFILIIGCSILIIPPFYAPFTIQNTNWDGLSNFKTLTEQLNLVTEETTIPLRLLGEIQTNIIIIVGGNLPYFREESTYLRAFVENGGHVLIFEDKGYARQLTADFGIALGGTVIDQDHHARNPYQPEINQSAYTISGFDFSSKEVVFNSAVRVKQSLAIPNTKYYPIFQTHGRSWEDQNADGQFYKDSEFISENCYLGAMIVFNGGGSLTVIGDSAFPTNDMINKRENYGYLLDLFSFISRGNGNQKILFDESRKLWLPPTGKAAIGIISVLIMGLFHSPLIAIIVIITIGGIFGIIKNEDITIRVQRLHKSITLKKETSIPPYLQSEEEEEFARMGKHSENNIYRIMLLDEINKVVSKIPNADKEKFEKELRKRSLNARNYHTLIKQIRRYRED